MGIAVNGRPIVDVGNRQPMFAIERALPKLANMPTCERRPSHALQHMFVRRSCCPTSEYHAAPFASTFEQFESAEIVDPRVVPSIVGGIEKAEARTVRAAVVGTKMFLQRAITVLASHPIGPLESTAWLRTCQSPTQKSNCRFSCAVQCKGTGVAPWAIRFEINTNITASANRSVISRPIDENPAREPKRTRSLLHVIIQRKRMGVWMNFVRRHCPAQSSERT
jgi:hypothetical protein